MVDLPLVPRQGLASRKSQTMFHDRRVGPQSGQYRPEAETCFVAALFLGQLATRLTNTKGS